MEKSHDILHTFADFTDGIRFLMLTHRGKEGRGKSTNQIG